MTMVHTPVVRITPDVPDDEAVEADRRCREQALIDLYPGLQDATDETLIDIIADGPLALPGEDPDEITAVAVIVLDRRVRNVIPWRPA